MLAVIDGLIKHGRQRVGNVQPPQNGEAHPAAAGLTGNGAHDRDARNIEQDEDQVAVGRRRAAKFLAHHAHCSGRHYAVAFAGFNRVRQYAQAEGVFQALPGLFYCTQKFVTEAELSWVELLFLDVFRGVERVQGADNHLFCHRASEQAHGCLPVVFLYANRFEDRRSG